MIYTLRIVDTETGLEQERVDAAGDLCGLAGTRGVPGRPATGPFLP